MKLNEIIKRKRSNLGENQAEFGKRFGVSTVAVSNWETGKAEAPYKVLEFALFDQIKSTNGEKQMFIRQDLDDLPEAKDVVYAPLDDTVTEILEGKNIKGIVLTKENKKYKKRIGFAV